MSHLKVANETLRNWLSKIIGPWPQSIVSSDLLKCYGRLAVAKEAAVSHLP